MGIIARFGSIMESNINALLDKCEDPAKMIDQTLRELNEDLAEVKKETAAVMAEEKGTRRIVDGLNVEINKYTEAAKKAIACCNADDAKTLLVKKQELESQLATATSTWQIAKANADKMTTMYNKLVSDINTLNGRRENVKAQMSMAKAQQNVNKMTATMNAAGAMDKFSRMEEKAQKMLDSATAEAELATGLNPGDEAATLMSKYSVGSGETVDAELAKLKAEMGM